MNKKNSIWLLVAVWTLVSCGTVKSTREKPAVALAQSSLTPEQQRKYDYFFLEAMRLKEKKDYASAFGLLQHCLDIHPNAASALYEVSQYYMFLRQVPQGQEALEKAVANAPDNYWYSQGLASLYQQQNELDKAVTLLEQMVVRFPAKQDPLFNLLDLYGRQEKYDEVISTLNRLEKHMGKNEQLSMEKFRIYLQMKDDKKAFQEIESLVQEYPMDMRYQVILGDVYLQNGKKQEAYDVYQKVLAAEPDNPMAIFSMASYYKQTGQEELYQQQLDTLLLNKKVTPDTKVGVMRQMIVENEQADKDSTQIIALFDRIMKQEQDDPQIPMLYAQYLLSKNMEAESVPVLEQVVDLDPTNNAARMMLIGAAAQFGIFGAYMIALEIGFDPMQAAAIGIIGGADGPTAIFLSSKLAPNLMGAIAVSAYSYMALVPVIQPPVMRLLTTKKERLIRMKAPRAVSHTEKVMFPIIGLLLTCFLVPSGLPLLGMLFFGNLLKESGVTRRLAETARGPLIDTITILLGLTVGASTQASEFLTWDSIKIFILGALSFFIATASGVIFVKIFNLVLKKENKINPLIGNAGVSAVPDSARISQVVGLEYDPTNYLLMHAMGPNVAGVIGSAVAAGILLGFLV